MDQFVPTFNSVLQLTKQLFRRADRFARESGLDWKGWKVLPQHFGKSGRLNFVNQPLGLRHQTSHQLLESHFGSGDADHQGASRTRILLGPSLPKQLPAKRFFDSCVY